MKLDGEDYNNYVKVKNHCVNGECIRCGECCGDYLPITEKELKTIRRYVRKNNVKSYRNRVVSTPFDITCPFLNGQKLCTIYEVRPSICSTFKCNLPLEELEKNRDEHILNGIRRPVSLREEIFGETSMLEGFTEFLMAYNHANTKKK